MAMEPVPTRPRAPSESDPLLGETTVDYSSEAALVRRTKKPPLRRSGRASRWAACCAMCSCSCTLLLLWIGVYVSLGWNYQPHQWSRAQLVNVRFNAFVMAAIYFLGFLVSLFFWRRDERIMRSIDDDANMEMTAYRERDE